MAEIFWAWFGSFVAVGALALTHYTYLDGTGGVLLIGSFGASAVLVFGSPASPLAQPRNLLGGHLISALAGVTAAQMLLPSFPVLAAALAVSFALGGMLATATLHPPGGATALVAVIGGDAIYELSYGYLLLPVASGAALLLAIALLVNNLIPGRSYPFRE